MALHPEYTFHCSLQSGWCDSYGSLCVLRRSCRVVESGFCPAWYHQRRSCCGTKDAASLPTYPAQQACSVALPGMISFVSSCYVCWHTPLHAGTVYDGLWCYTSHCSIPVCLVRFGVCAADSLVRGQATCTQHCCDPELVRIFAHILWVSPDALLQACAVVCSWA